MATKDTSSLEAVSEPSTMPKAYATSRQSNADHLLLELDAFIRSIGINKATPHAIFLGAGASISSGVPSAASCIWEWKRSIFLTKHPGLEAQFSELSLPAVRLKIQRWLDNQGKYPVNGSTEEYGFYIQECYPISADRRAFFQEMVRQARPHIGYKLMATLAEVGLIDSVWMTNFDGLPGNALRSTAVTPIEIGVDCQDRLPRKPNRNELLCVSIHGDYRYDSLKNTEEELQAQEAALRDALIARIENTPLIVMGYSGRDASVMNALEEAYTNGIGTLYWCGFGDEDIPQRVRQLLERARSAGRSAFYVRTGGFDDVMLRIALHCLEGVAAEEARKVINSQQPEPTQVRADFSLPDLPTCGVIKSNAFLLIPPGEVYEFELKIWPEENVWEYFDESTKGKGVVAVPFRTKGYAFSTIDEIRSAFADNVGEKIERVPINDVDLSHEDGAISSLIRRAVVLAMARRADVNTDGRDFLWSKTVLERKSVNNQEYAIHNAVVVYLRRIGGKNYLVLKPTIRIESSIGEVPESVERDLKLTILGWQHNKEFNDAVETCRKLLISDLEFPANCASPFRFQIRRTPLLARVTSADTSRQIRISKKFENKIEQIAFELPEPRLVFSNRQGNGVTLDAHPVRGIVQNKPFDYPLTLRQLASTIQVGVICPGPEAARLNQYLQNLNRNINPGKYEADYLLPFQGFNAAFGTPLVLPEPGHNLWMTCPEIDPDSGPQQGALQLSSHITACLSAMKAAAAPNVIVIFIPTRWANWRSFETESERFDLHNFVKASSVPQGIATQFLEEDTLSNELQCRIRWWLSLAIYVKSMRTPWVLSALDGDTAFVGLGMSLDRKAAKGTHVILGCSHLYNAQGEGLQFRLSKIENPVFRRRNAFMSYDDARRVGETIRQLFWESKLRLPGRVVLHKLTPFLYDEKKGLQDGLSGVKEIELLEIHLDDALRYLSSIVQRDGSFEADGFPVKRGTLLKLDRDSALLWVHGVSKAVNPGRNYYQGKRRIPAPLVIRRHAGSSDLTLRFNFLRLSVVHVNN